MKNIEEVIAEHSFFADLPDDRRKVIAGCAQMASFKPDDYLFRLGRNAEHFFLIRHGRVSLEQDVPGGDVFRFETVDAGAVIGWSWLFPPYKWQFDARAIEKVSAIQFDGKCLRDKCEDDPALGYDLMKRFALVMTRRYADTRLQLIDVYGNSRA
jgi:CRP/FNR family transcriptional regulator, cyclic AMP receptor protein